MELSGVCDLGYFGWAKATDHTQNCEFFSMIMEVERHILKVRCHTLTRCRPRDNSLCKEPKCTSHLF